MRTVVIALASVALLSAPAYSQKLKDSKPPSADPQQVAEQKKRAAEDEKAYNAAVGRIPDKADRAAYDPWRSMR
jgi:hypothetical protein